MQNQMVLLVYKGSYAFLPDNSVLFYKIMAYFKLNPVL